MFALIDGNNFYVSCERVFQPRLIGRPVVSLSNNDGCAISRSNEAKELGVKMGQPWFQVRLLVSRAATVFDDKGELRDQGVREQLAKFIEVFAAFARSQRRTPAAGA